MPRMHVALGVKSDITYYLHEHQAPHETMQLLMPNTVSSSY